MTPRQPARSNDGGASQLTKEFFHVCQQRQHQHTGAPARPDCPSLTSETHMKRDRRAGGGLPQHPEQGPETGVLVARGLGGRAGGLEGGRVGGWEGELGEECRQFCLFVVLISVVIHVP